MQSMFRSEYQKIEICTQYTSFLLLFLREDLCFQYVTITSVYLIQFHLFFILFFQFYPHLSDLTNFDEL